MSPRSRSSTRASRPRSSNTRDRPAARTQFLRAPIRWPRCSFPVGRMPDTTRARPVISSATNRSQTRSRWSADDTMPRNRPVRINTYRMMKPYGRIRSNWTGEPRRQQPHEHIAAVERRNRQHVEHGEQHVQHHHARARRRRRLRPALGRARRPRRSPRAARRRPRAGGCWPDRRRRSTRIAARLRQMPHVHRHRLGPADERHAGHQRNQREQHRADS